MKPIDFIKMIQTLETDTKEKIYYILVGATLFGNKSLISPKTPTLPDLTSLIESVKGELD